MGPWRMEHICNIEKEIVLGARVDPTTEEKINNLVIDNRPDNAITKPAVHSHTLDTLLEKIFKPISDALHRPCGKWKIYNDSLIKIPKVLSFILAKVRH